MAKLNLNQMLNELQNSCKLQSKNQYVRYIQQLDKANNGQTANWINSAIKGKNLTNPLDYVLQLFDNWRKSYTGTHSQKTISNWKSGYKQLSISVLGIFYANVWAFSNNSNRIDLALCQIVAQNALFADPSLVGAVIKGYAGTKNNIGKGNPHASWDHMTTVRDTKVKKGTTLNISVGGVTYTCKADDNTNANRYIKQAVSISKGIVRSKTGDFVDYEACHIWDIPGDPRYYASIANLVLLPRAYGQLSDHCPAVKELLRYEAYKRFGFLPVGQSIPSMPKYYNQITWRY